MERLLLNQEPLNKKSVEEDRPIIDLMNHIAKTYLKQNEVITSIKLNEQEFDATVENDVFNEPIKNFDSIDLTYKTQKALTYEALESCETTLENILEKIMLISDQYKRNETDIANATFVEIVEVTDLFIQLMNLIHAHSYNLKHKYHQHFLQL